MMIIDSCGWLEWFADGDLAGRYKPYLEQRDRIIVPAIIIYEVYKVLKREISEEKALLAVAYIKQLQVVPIDETLALAAADISLNEKLAMADAIIAAVSRTRQCAIITSDSDLKNQPNVTFIPKP